MIDWKTFLISAVIVGTGIYLVDQSSSEAAWLLTFTILIGVAFANPNFGSELMGILKSQ